MQSHKVSHRHGCRIPGSAGVLAATLLLCLAGAACSAPPLNASKQIMLQVPADMAAPPLHMPRTLNVPHGFTISLFARVPGARFMALSPSGDVLISNPGAGTVTLLRPDQNGKAQRYTFASQLRHPHDIVFHRVRDKQYVYIAESHRIIRAAYDNGATRIGSIEVVVDHLPDASSPGLKGSYGHQLKNIALAGDRLYVSIASTCNACVSDTTSDPVRGAIYEYDADGGNRRLYAQGLRNAEGLAFRPGTGELWVVVNNRDNIAYPDHRDIDGDGKDDYGRVMQAYVDNHPPDLLVKVREGAHYGWPFCNANPDKGLDDMPYDRDVQLNPDGSQLDCEKAERATKGLPPHSAPLGLSFLHDSGLPARYRNALVTALHGCWNCSRLNGHKVVLYPLTSDGRVGDMVDLVTGWVTDAEGRNRWGRPVDAVPDGQGGLYISDDYAGAIYLLKAE
jgi:glucose/arabinose dehydrogenase